MKHKKWIAFMLVTAVAVNAMVPAFAEENEDDSAGDGAAYTVTYAQVEQMVLDRNLQIQSNGLTIGNMSDEDETKARYRDLANTIQSTSNALDAILKEAPNDQNKDLQTIAGATKISLSSLLATFSAQGDVSDDDYKLTELQMQQASSQLVESAQSLFSVYYQLQYNIEQLTNTRVTLENAAKKAQAQYGAGLGTAVSVTDAQANVTSMDNNIADLQNQSKEMGYQMNQLLGHSYNDKITFGKMPAPDTAYVGKINLEKDVAAATAASYDVQIQQVKYNLTNDGTNQNRDNRQIASNNIKLATQKIGPSVEKQYDTIQKQQAALALDQKTLDTAKLKWNQAQLQYSTGAISKIDLDTAENNYLKQQTTVETDQATLFWNIETYKWILKGLPASS